MKWKIWSNEHKSWWASASRGYTPSRTDAGLYSFEEAIEIVRDANRFIADNKPPNEAMVPEDKE